MSDTGSEIDQTCSPYEFLSETESNNGTGTPKILSLSERLEIAREIKDSLVQSMERPTIETPTVEQSMIDSTQQLTNNDQPPQPEATLDTIQQQQQQAQIREEKLNQHISEMIENVNTQAIRQIESEQFKAEQQQSLENVINEINVGNITTGTVQSGQISPKSIGSDGDGQLVGITGFLARVAIKAKSSVDSMITTLDPGMKEFLFSGGDVNILVASDKPAKVDPIRDAFIDVFGRATVKGMTATSSTVAEQPTGADWAQLAAEQRVANIRANHTTDVPQNQVIVALENCLLELIPEQWFDVGCLYLEDPLTAARLTTFTQTTPVPAEVVNHLKFETPNNYERAKSGFSTTVGSQMAQRLNCPHECWHEAYSGVSRQSSIYLAAVVLARLYKDRLSGLRNNSLATL